MIPERPPAGTSAGHPAPAEPATDGPAVGPASPFPAGSPAPAATRPAPHPRSRRALTPPAHASGAAMTPAAPHRGAVKSASRPTRRFHDRVEAKAQHVLCSPQRCPAIPRGSAAAIAATAPPAVKVLAEPLPAVAASRCRCRSRCRSCAVMPAIPAPLRLGGCAAVPAAVDPGATPYGGPCRGGGRRLVRVPVGYAAQRPARPVLWGAGTVSAAGCGGRAGDGAVPRSG